MSILVFYGVSGTVGTSRPRSASFWPTERVALEPVCWWEKSFELEVQLSKSVHESAVSIVLTLSVQVLIFHLLPLSIFFQNLKTKCRCCSAICNVSSDIFSSSSRSISENGVKMIHHNNSLYIFCLPVLNDEYRLLPPAGLGSYFLQQKLRMYKLRCHQDIMLAVSVYANYRYVHVRACHRLRTILIFV